MPDFDRSGRESSSTDTERLQWAADRLRTEVVGSLIEEGERLWRRLAEAHDGAEGRVRESVAEIETEVSARLDARAADDEAKLDEYASALEQLSQRRLEAHAKALTESVAARAGEAVASEVARVRAETSTHLAALGREIVELAQFVRELADEIELRSRPRPLDIPRRNPNGTSSLERR